VIVTQQAKGFKAAPGMILIKKIIVYDLPESQTGAEIWYFHFSQMKIPVFTNRQRII